LKFDEVLTETILQFFLRHRVYMHNQAIVYIWNDFIHTGNAMGL